MILGAVIGGAGVLLIVGTATGALDGWGIAASIASMALSSIGAILTKRWQDDTPVLTVTAWQLVVGGLELLAAALDLTADQRHRRHAGRIDATDAREVEDDRPHIAAPRHVLELRVQRSRCRNGQVALQAHDRRATVSLDAGNRLGHPRGGLQDRAQPRSTG